ncbi:gamma-glutamyltransferase 1 [Sinobacterium caligoides]|uniref:Glutathione hydrolase proenzyme n=1 Tax=Sinobacterium caligoides TaxID=933926 RepID=A0A3N2E1V5_9GAMM|nr:gamma-glutamyltransferase [Sinobacterium caligoides]ROS05659.1 gamma-glutamyltransferase 1 [Sinobacterium caligoides]
MMKAERLSAVFLCVLCLAETSVARQTASAVPRAIQQNPQRFQPAWSAAGIVVAEEQVAAQVGAEMLRAGGNAVDAAVATGFALAVTLPRAGNLGGGGFMVLWLQQERKALAINYREMAPAAASRTMFLDAQGEVDKTLATKHYLSAGVPGTVAGLVLAQQQYGKLSLAQVMKPAIRLATEGIVVTRALSQSLSSSRDHLQKDASSMRKFFAADGGALLPGQRWRQPALASSLTLISEQGASAFYEGKIARQIVAAMAEHGGLVTLQDLKNYRAKITATVEGRYRGYRVFSMPPPSSGGITLITMLNILEHYDLAKIGNNNAEYFHLLTETMNLAYNDRNYYLGDADFVDVPQRRLTSKSYGKQLAKRINRQQHTPAKEISHLKRNDKESNDTTHFSVIDKEGNMVANTYTLNWSYGSGFTVPGAGFLLNNEMDDFAAKPGSANSYGLVQGEANAVAAGKRPLSSMTPTLLLDPRGRPFLVTGSPGGSRIISTTLQVILNRVDHGLNLAESVSLPRVHSQLWPEVLSYEQGVSSDTLRQLEAKGHRLQLFNAMGSANSAEFLPEQGGSLGAADPRRGDAMAVPQ